MKGERSPKTVCTDLFFLKLVILCVIEKRKREGSDQSKRDIDIYPMKQRYHMSPERDSKSHDISHGYGKEPAGGRPYMRKGRSDVSRSSSMSLRMSDNERRKVTQDSM